MVIRIKRVENNVDYIENKDTAIFSETDDGMTIVQNNMHALCDRIWLSEEFSLDIGWNYRYEFSSSIEGTLEGCIIEKGIDKNGPYIVFLLDGAYFYAHNNNPRPKPLIGENQIEVILSPDMIKGSHELLKVFNDRWPSFHESNLAIIKKTSSIITLEFSGGFLFDKVIQVILKGIVFEEYDDNLEYFTKQWLTSVEFRKKRNSFEFRLYNDYQTSAFPEGFDISRLQDPDFDSSILNDICIVEEFKNHGVIICREIEFIVHVDEDRKLQLEEEFKKFKEMSSRTENK